MQVELLSIDTDLGLYAIKYNTSKNIAIFTDVQISDYGILWIKGPKKNLNKRRLKAMFHYSLYT